MYNNLNAAAIQHRRQLFSCRNAPAGGMTGFASDFQSQHRHGGTLSSPNPTRNGTLYNVQLRPIYLHTDALPTLSLPTKSLCKASPLPALEPQLLRLHDLCANARVIARRSKGQVLAVLIFTEFGDLSRLFVRTGAPPLY